MGVDRDWSGDLLVSGLRAHSYSHKSRQGVQVKKVRGLRIHAFLLVGGGGDPMNRLPRHFP